MTVIDVPEYICTSYEQKGIADLSHLIGQVNDMWNWMKLTGCLHIALNGKVYNQTEKQKMSFVEEHSGIHLMRLDESQQTFIGVTK